MMVLDGVCRFPVVASDRVGGRVFFPEGAARGRGAPAIVGPFMVYTERTDG